MRMSICSANMLAFVFIVSLAAVEAFRFPPAIMQQLTCDTQHHKIDSPYFDINTMRHNRIYNTLYLYPGNTAYGSCYVNVYRSIFPNYDCKNIAKFDCESSKSRSVSSYTGFPSRTGGTICYAISTYKYFAIPIYLISNYECLVLSMIKENDDVCASLKKSHNFSQMQC